MQNEKFTRRGKTELECIDPGPFVLGVNLPWLQYGCDFGANAWQPEGGVGRPEQRERLRRSFGRLAERGLTAVRWFVLCDGRAGVRFEAPGLVLGLDECVLAGPRGGCRGGGPGRRPPRPGAVRLQVVPAGQR